MLNVNLHDAYDIQGEISQDFTGVMSGYKHNTSLLPNLQLIDQHISSHTDVLCTEQAHQGFYFSLIGSSPIINTNNIDEIQVSYHERDLVGDFMMAENENKSLFQIHIAPEQLALLFNETEEQVIQYFAMLFDAINSGSNCISLPITEKSKAVCQLLLANQGQTLSLIGHVYACIFTLVEQLKMLGHIAKCEDCQSKIFQAQNLLEVHHQIATKIDHLAHRVGLNKEALTLGFQHLVGQSIEHYCMRSRIHYAAAMLRKDPKSKPSVMAESGFSESQFESAFIQHFGISSHQYGQIH